FRTEHNQGLKTSSIYSRGANLVGEMNMKAADPLVAAGVVRHDFMAGAAAPVLPVGLINIGQLFGGNAIQNATHNLVQRGGAHQLTPWLPVFNLVSADALTGNHIANDRQGQTGIAVQFGTMAPRVMV